MKIGTCLVFAVKAGCVLIFFVIFLLTYGAGVFAETIVLKDGREIFAEIKNETEDAVVVSRGNGNFIYSISRDRIESIRKSTPEEIERYSVRPAAETVSGDAENEKGRRQRLNEYRLERYERQVQAAKKARGRLKIKFSKGRFGVVDAVLNGKVKAALYVDTGASMVLISGAIAGKLGINPDEEKEKVLVVLADGSTRTATRVTLNSVEVGSSKVRDVEAAISEDPPGHGLDGLLGMSFLRAFHVKMDAKENCLVLERY